MSAGITVAGLLGTSAIAAMAVVTWLLADALDAVDAQVEELFGDQPRLPDELAAPHAEPWRGSGHERGSAACDRRTGHGEGL